MPNSVLRLYFIQKSDNGSPFVFRIQKDNSYQIFLFVQYFVTARTFIAT